MAKNRKNQSAAIRFGPALKALFLCLLIAGSAVGYVWQKNAIYRLGDEIKKRETALSSAQKRNMMLGAQLAHLESPAELETPEGGFEQEILKCLKAVWPQEQK